MAHLPHSGVQRWFDGVRDRTDEFVDRLLERRLTLGVTGFSRSGKSTFLTSFIHQLRHFQNAQLTALPPDTRHRLIGVELIDVKGNGLPRFPYDQGIRALSDDPPRWPDPTEGISTLMLELRCRPRGGVMSALGRRYERLYIEITDYPGEWLLDLPLLGVDYLGWCEQCQSLFSQQPRQTLLGSLYDDLARLDPLAPFDEHDIERHYRSYLAFLKRCRAENLNVIQPGRFLLEDKTSRESLFPFVPLLELHRYGAEELARVPSQSLLGVMQQRYQHYCEHWVKPFYRDHFSRVSRHLVLVDVLQALNGGEGHLEDMQLGLTQVLGSFDYGQNSLIRRLFAPVVEKVIFVASKIDQVLPDQHENIRVLTGTMVHEAYRRASYEQVELHTEAVSAVRTTTKATHQQRQMLMGQVEGGVAGYLSHPDIPDHIPSAAEWQQFEGWVLRRLLPPSGLKLLQGGTLPHIRLDSVIRELIGDKL